MGVIAIVMSCCCYTDSGSNLSTCLILSCNAARSTRQQPSPFSKIRLLGITLCSTLLKGVTSIFLIEARDARKQRGLSNMAYLDMVCLHHSWRRVLNTSTSSKRIDNIAYCSILDMVCLHHSWRRVLLLEHSILIPQHLHRLPSHHDNLYLKNKNSQKHLQWQKSLERILHVINLHEPIPVQRLAGWLREREMSLHSAKLSTKTMVM